MRTPHHYRRGFSLLELMVVIAILGIMMTYALPNVLGTKKTEQLKSATDDVINVFHYAKVRAANAFVAYGVQYTAENSGHLEVFAGTGPSCASITFAGDPVKELWFNAPEVHGGEWNEKSAQRDIGIFEVSPPSLDRLCFTPDGRFVQASDSRPVPATLEAGSYAAGEYVVSLARLADDGSPLGIKHHVIVGYSGRARAVFGEDLTSSEGEGR